MAQLSDDCFAFGGPMMSVDEAVALIAARVTPVRDFETVALVRADGRILAQDMTAPLRLPPFTNMGTVRRVIPRWRKTAVLAWLAEREVLPPLLVRMEPVILAPQKKRGRPRKVAS